MVIALDRRKEAAKQRQRVARVIQLSVATGSNNDLHTVSEIVEVKIHHLYIQREIF